MPKTKTTETKTAAPKAPTVAELKETIAGLEKQIADNTPADIAVERSKVELAGVAREKAVSEANDARVEIGRLENIIQDKDKQIRKLTGDSETARVI